MKTWWEYVSEGLARNGMTQTTLADAIGVNRSTITGWKNKAALPESKYAIATARAFGTQVMEALVISGHVPADEVDMPALTTDPRRLTNDELTLELRRRFKDL
jgi:DNA-binding XRE family transcriptional regulator